MPKNSVRPKWSTFRLSLLPFQSRRCCHSGIEKGKTHVRIMVKGIERRKRPAWSRVALIGVLLLSDVRPAIARTWDVLVEPATYILLDREMIRQIPESDPFFTQTQLGTDPPTSMPVPTPSPVPQPTSMPSISPSMTPTRTQSPTATPVPTAPTFSPYPTEYVSYPPGEEPTLAPTPIYRNAEPDSLCRDGERLMEVHMQDTFGDGWEGRNLTIIVADSPHVLSKATETVQGNSTVIKYKVTTLNGTDVYYEPGKQIYTGTLYGGELAVNYTCIRPGVCYEAHMIGGAWAEEILWEIKTPTYNVTPDDNQAGLVIAKGGAPADCQFSIPDEVTGMTFCPTTCNRFPLDPTAFPSASPTGSLMPASNVPSSNSPSDMPSLFPSLEPSGLPSNLPSMEPSESLAPSPPPIAPVSVNQRVPMTPTTSNAPTVPAPVSVPTIDQPTLTPNVSPPTWRSANGGRHRRPVPTAAASPTRAVSPTRRPRTNASPVSTPGPPTLAVAGPTPQVSNRNPNTRPANNRRPMKNRRPIKKRRPGKNRRPGNNRRKPRRKHVNYRKPWNTGNTALQPTPSPVVKETSQPTPSPVVKETLHINAGSQPTPVPVVNETLDVSDVGNGIRR